MIPLLAYPFVPRSISRCRFCLFRSVGALDRRGCRLHISIQNPAVHLPSRSKSVAIGRDYQRSEREARGHFDVRASVDPDFHRNFDKTAIVNDEYAR